MKEFVTNAAIWAGLALLAVAVPSEGASPPEPAPHTVGELTYLTGGVGIDEREAMSAHRGDYNLHLKFAAVGGAYLAKIRIRIEDANGRRLLDSESDGPWFFANVPKGKYKLIVENDGESQERTVDLSKRAVFDEVFRWKVAQVN